MARKAYTFPDDVVLDPSGPFGIERAKAGGWVAFNDAADIGLGSRRLWTSDVFNTDSEAMLVRNQAVRIAERKMQEAHVAIVSSMSPKRGNRGYLPHELEGEAREALADKHCVHETPDTGLTPRALCGGTLAYRSWGVRVLPSGTTVVGVAQCVSCGRVTSAEKAL